MNRYEQICIKKIYIFERRWIFFFRPAQRAPRGGAAHPAPAGRARGGAGAPAAARARADLLYFYSQQKKGGLLI